MLVIALILITTTVVIVAKILEKPPVLDLNLIKEACSKIQETSKLDSNHSVIESHKILIASLQNLYPNKKLKAVELLEKISKELPNEKTLWKFHRMRNKAAHEIDYQISEMDAKAAREIFKETLLTQKKV